MLRGALAIFSLLCLGGTEEVFSQTSNQAFEKNLAVILDGNEQMSVKTVQRGVEGLIPILFNPKNLEKPELAEGLWRGLDAWLSQNGTRLQFETLTVMEAGLVAAVDAASAEDSYTKTAWKPSLFWGVIAGSALEVSLLRWMRKITHRFSVKWQWALRRSKCCRSRLLLLAGKKLSRFSTKHPAILNKILLSALSSLGSYFFLFKDKEPGDLEVFWATQQILPKIASLKKSAPRRQGT